MEGFTDWTYKAGQIPYMSRVSGQIEHLPVGISLLASPGALCIFLPYDRPPCQISGSSELGQDLMLLDLVTECLEKAGRPTAVLTGREMF